ncbi:MAG: ribonuclease HII [Deltaproteobacteria bacterium]|nr:ribonuclease HII [Deltaproteobacteria bacterium]MCL5791549.1 ribonuclease HII [Deltaproteobacteria bacterium]
MDCKTFVEDMQYSCIAGIDEVGRGPLAGPVVACAVVIPDHFECKLIKDSKLLSSKQRLEAYECLRRHAISYGIGIVYEQDIDRFNIRNATRLAMEKALALLNYTVKIVLIDGDMKIDTDIPQKTIISGDRLCLSISAASIIAKVYRDSLMAGYAKKYPQYNFLKNKGYGTKEHVKAIVENGPCPIHRKTFLIKLIEHQNQLNLPINTGDVI